MVLEYFTVTTDKTEETEGIFSRLSTLKRKLPLKIPLIPNRSPALLPCRFGAITSSLQKSFPIGKFAADKGGENVRALDSSRHAAAKEEKKIAKLTHSRHHHGLAFTTLSSSFDVFSSPRVPRLLYLYVSAAFTVRGRTTGRISSAENGWCNFVASHSHLSLLRCCCYVWGDSRVGAGVVVVGKY